MFSVKQRKLVVVEHGATCAMEIYGKAVDSKYLSRDCLVVFLLVMHEENVRNTNTFRHK